jgi:hypothetical protein
VYSLCYSSINPSTHATSDGRSLSDQNIPPAQLGDAIDYRKAYLIQIIVISCVGSPPLEKLVSAPFTGSSSFTQSCASHPSAHIQSQVGLARTPRTVPARTRLPTAPRTHLHAHTKTVPARIRLSALTYMPRIVPARIRLPTAYAPTRMHTPLTRSHTHLAHPHRYFLPHPL